ncbi:protein of unknown function (plasmid) [Cupriavidus taiwanensis]|uniref:Uncharacterized protein n=1 Tax=Cupriavidus taiwanensis TaxID=164546 RepID=A0A9Q7XSI8_9BURK|nr:protein of unknown function [Cupriavidus taiwanensis]
MSRTKYPDAVARYGAWRGLQCSPHPQSRQGFHGNLHMPLALSRFNSFPPIADNKSMRQWTSL